jgi:hypothetical protein
MSSPTKQTESIRRAKRIKHGRKRKSALQNHGTTKSHKELFAKKG